MPRKKKKQNALFRNHTTGAQYLTILSHANQNVFVIGGRTLVARRRSGCTRSSESKGVGGIGAVVLAHGVGGIGAVVLAIAGFGDKAFKPNALVAIKSANAATADHLLIDFLPRVTTGGVYKRSVAVKRGILGGVSKRYTPLPSGNGQCLSELSSSD